VRVPVSWAKLLQRYYLLRGAGPPRRPHAE
jgi:hypothetical protein